MLAVGRGRLKLQATALIAAALGASSVLGQPGSPDGGARPAHDGGAGANREDKRVDLLGQVVDAKGRPVSELVVFAVEKGTVRIVGATRPDPDGLFQMRLSSRVHDFGVLSSRWLIGGFQAESPRSIKVTVYPAFPDTDPVQVVKQAKSWAKVAALAESGGMVAAPGAPSGMWIAPLTGTVTDETGVPLQGVRLLAMQDSTSRLVAATQTDRQGRFTLVTLAGMTRIYVYAPGLALKEGKVKGRNRVDLVLSIDVEIASLTLRTGRTLSFKMSDSIYPEMLPPAKVAAVMSFDYGIALADGCFCPGDLIHQPPPDPAELKNACAWSRRQSNCASPQKCPATVWARSCMLPNHWWLRLIQTNPPNPGLLRDENDIPRMWWYDAIRAMQEDDARVAAKGKGK
jgi:hypothetical protein